MPILNAARSAEERRLAEDKMRLEKLERAAEEVRLAKEKTRQTLPLLRKAAAPAQAAKKPVNAQPVKAAQAPARLRNYNNTNNRAAGK